MKLIFLIIGALALQACSDATATTSNPTSSNGDYTITITSKEGATVESGGIVYFLRYDVVSLHDSQYYYEGCTIPAIKSYNSINKFSIAYHVDEDYVYVSNGSTVTNIDLYKLSGGSCEYNSTSDSDYLMLDEIETPEIFENTGTALIFKG